VSLRNGYEHYVQPAGFSALESYIDVRMKEIGIT
jgi:hypothetical protein